MISQYSLHVCFSPWCHCPQGFQQEITLNTNKIDALIVFGENLIQKSAPLDAVLIEDELEELHSYCQEVFGRVARFHHRLVNRRPVSYIMKVLHSFQCLVMSGFI